MSYLLLVGPMLEEKHGHKAIIITYIATAFATGIIQYIFYQGRSLYGASGIAFALIIMASLTKFKEGEMPLTFILIASFCIGQQVYDGLFSPSSISNMSHIIGGIIGIIMGYRLNKKSYTELLLEKMSQKKY